jgi:hypothetical protein
MARNRLVGKQSRRCPGSRHDVENPLCYTLVVAEKLMLRRKLVAAENLRARAEAIRPQFKRYPASFMRRVKKFLGESSHV